MGGACCGAGAMGPGNASNAARPVALAPEGAALRLFRKAGIGLSVVHKLRVTHQMLPNVLPGRTTAEQENLIRAEFQAHHERASELQDDWNASHERAQKEPSTRERLPSPRAISLDGALSLTPVSYLDHNPNATENTTWYTTFFDNKCELFSPTNLPLVTGKPFTFCLVTSTEISEVGILLDGNLPMVCSIKPSETKSNRNVFFGEMCISEDCKEALFCIVHPDGNSIGFFKFDGCINSFEAAAKGSTKGAEIDAAKSCIASEMFPQALVHLSTALVFDTDADTLVMRGKVYMRQREFMKASSDAQLALALDRQSVEAWDLKAESEFIRGNLQSVIQMADPSNMVPAGSRVHELAEQSKIQLELLEKSVNRWVIHDKRATECPETKDIVGSITSLGAYLTAPFETDIDKHRVIFRWVTDHIAYNAQGFKTGDYGDCSPDGVLQSRVGVCAGYSELYKALATAVGIESVSCSGYSKGFGFKPGQEMTVNHAWNCINVDGIWIPLDSCWAAGSVDYTYSFTKGFNSFWWMTPPEHFVYSHFPEDATWLCLPEPPSLTEFSKSLNLKGDFFANDVELMSHEDLIIPCQESVKIQLREKGDRLFLMASLAGDSNAVQLEYDTSTQVHTIMVTPPKKKQEYKLDLYFGKEQYGTYAHLMDYLLMHSP